MKEQGMCGTHMEITLQLHGFPQPGSFLNNGLKGTEKDMGLVQREKAVVQPIEMLRGTS